MAVVAFALCLAVISGMESVLIRLAYRHGLLRNPPTEVVYRVGLLQSTIPVVLFLASIPIAFWSPTAALLSWLLAFPLGLWIDRRTKVSHALIMSQDEVEDDGR